MEQTKFSRQICIHWEGTVCVARSIGGTRIRKSRWDKAGANWATASCDIHACDGLCTCRTIKLLICIEECHSGRKLTRFKLYVNIFVWPTEQESKEMDYRYILGTINPTPDLSGYYPDQTHRRATSLHLGPTFILLSSDFRHWLEYLESNTGPLCVVLPLCVVSHIRIDEFKH